MAKIDHERLAELIIELGPDWRARLDAYNAAFAARRAGVRKHQGPARKPPRAHRDPHEAGRECLHIVDGVPWRGAGVVVGS